MPQGARPYFLGTVHQDRIGWIDRCALHELPVHVFAVSARQRRIQCGQPAPRHAMAGIAAGRRLDHRDSAHRDVLRIDSGGMSPRWRVMPPVHISEAPPEGMTRVRAWCKITSFLHHSPTLEDMPMAGKRASLSISKPNDSWIQAQIASGEFASRSEVINDLIRRAREIEVIRARLIAAEQGGLSATYTRTNLAASKRIAQKWGAIDLPRKPIRRRMALIGALNLHHVEVFLAGAAVRTVP